MEVGCCGNEFPNFLREIAAVVCLLCLALNLEVCSGSLDSEEFVSLDSTFKKDTTLKKNCIYIFIIKYNHNII